MGFLNGLCAGLCVASPNNINVAILLRNDGMRNDCQLQPCMWESLFFSAFVCVFCQREFQSKFLCSI